MQHYNQPWLIHMIGFLAVIWSVVLLAGKQALVGMQEWLFYTIKPDKLSWVLALTASLSFQPDG